MKTIAKLKILFFLLISIPGIIRAMEADQPIVKGVSEPIFTYNPRGEKETQEMVISYINLEDREPFTYATFKELIEEHSEKNEPFILALVISKKGTTTAYSFYDAYGLLTHIFGPNFIAPLQHRFNSPLSNFKPDLITVTLIDQIKFYTINNLSDPLFGYLGSDFDLHANPNENTKLFFQTFFKSLNPNSPEGDEAKIAFEKDKISAQYKLGSFYYQGKGVKKNYDHARNFFEKAATQTLRPVAQIEAQMGLGRIYYDGGYGVDRDYNRAREFLEKAATQTVSPIAQAAAQLFLGKIYYDGGYGIEKDYNRAREFFEKAAPQTVNRAAQAAAQLFLGRIYYNGGYGIEKDYNRAREFFEKAAAQTVNPTAQVEAQIDLGRIYYDGGYGVDRDYNRTREFLEKAATQTANPIAQVEVQIGLGTIYYDGGYGVDRDYNRAREFLEKAATQTVNQMKQIEAQIGLGKIYYSGGYGVDKDYNRAREFLEKAANQTMNSAAQAVAQSLLGRIKREEEAQSLEQQETRKRPREQEED
ncbi:MAG: DUF5092 domain-containing protein [bacterium]|nr:DUF5092 domain-containing protein [bacterium]